MWFLFLFNETSFCSVAFILNVVSLFSCVCVFVLVLRCDSLLWGIFLNFVFNIKEYYFV